MNPIPPLSRLGFAIVCLLILSAGVVVRFAGGASAPQPVPALPVVLTPEKQAEVLKWVEGWQAADRDAKAEYLAIAQKCAALEVQNTIAAAKVQAAGGDYAKAVERGDYWQQKHAEAVKKLWWYRRLLWPAVALALAAAFVFLAAKFTDWGGRTFGPWIVKGAAIAAGI